MDLGICNRLALVTGASRGIGRAIAIQLAAEGAEVVIVARSADALRQIAGEMPQPDKQHVLALDLMAAGAAQQVTDYIDGLGSLDIIVHNLGGSAGVFQTFAPAADWQSVWHFNVGIAHELNRIFIPRMAARHWGRIVHLSTLSTTTFNGYSAYVSAKLALNGYVKTVGREVAKDNVIVSAVAPGAIYSEGRFFAKLTREDPTALAQYFDNHLPTRRLGTAQDVGAVTAFLCSEHASFMAGAIVGVDGGGM